MGDKGKSIYGLDKIPTEELLKASRREVGELKSYIDELIYDKEMLNKEINRLKSQLAKLRIRYDNLLSQSLLNKKQ